MDHAARQGAAHALRQRLDAVQPQPALRRVAHRRRGRTAGHETLAAGGARNHPQVDPPVLGFRRGDVAQRSEEHTSELQSLMRISYAVFCLKKKKITNTTTT